MKCLLAVIALIFSLSPASAFAESLNFYTGANLTSPRTALGNSNLGSYIGFVSAGGYEFRLGRKFFFEADLALISRGYAGGYNLITLSAPAIFKYESTHWIIGVGAYYTTIMSSTDAQTLGLASTDYGPIAELGYQHSIASDKIIVIEGRASHSISDANTTGSTFHWNQLQGLIAIKLRIGSRSSNYY